MSLIVNCIHCGTDTDVEFESFGSTFDCPKCGAGLRLPRTGIETGTRVGGFRVEKLLGCGGMGDVFLATQLSMDRLAALKVLPPTLTQDREAVERFLNEVRMTARFEHPNIVTVFEAGEEAGHYYLAMSYVKGEDLDVALKRDGRFAQEAALGVGIKIASALGYAWQKGQILHRDIKPSNIMLDAQGEVKLMDLGIAKSLRDPNSSAETQSGFVVGTPFYMSPEQARGRLALDFRTDVYSLGATLFHLLTGTPPYDGEGPLDIMTMHVNEPVPSAREREPGVSQACDRMLAKMMAKAPDGRYDSWDDLIADLERVSHGKMPKGITAAKPKPRGGGKAKVKRVRAAPRPVTAAPRQGFPVALAVVAGGLLVLLCVVLLTGRGSAPPAGRPPPPVRGGDDAAKPPAKPPDPLEKLRHRLDAVERYAAANPEQWNEIQARFVKLSQMAEKTALAERVETAYAAFLKRRLERAGQVMTKLAARAEAVADAGHFTAAAKVYENYDGVLAAATAEQRAVFAKRYRRRAKEKKRPQTKKPTATPAQKTFDQWFPHLCEELTGGKTDTLAGRLETFRKGIQPDDLSDDAREILGELQRVDDVNTVIIRSFRPQLGKEVTVPVAAGGETFVLSGLDEDARMIIGEKHLKYGNMPVRLPVVKLTPQERFQRLGKEQGEGYRDVMRGLLLLEAGRAESARKYLLRSPLFVARALVDLLVARDDRHGGGATENGDAAGQAPAVAVDDEVAGALADLLDILGLTVDDLEAGDVPPRPKEPARRRFKRAMARFRDAHGGSAAGARALATLRDWRLAWRGRVAKNAAANPGAAAGAADWPDALQQYFRTLAERTPAFKPEAANVDWHDDGAGAVVSVRFNVGAVTDLSGLRTFLPELQTLILVGPGNRRSARQTGEKLHRAPLADLGPLAKMRLTRLECRFLSVKDLRPLKGMPLEVLAFPGCLVSDLSHLRGAPLREVNLDDCPIRSLDPLGACKLSRLSLNNTHVVSLSPLAHMEASLEYLSVAGSRLRSLSEISHLRPTYLDISYCRIRDLAPIRDMPLDVLILRGCDGANYTMIKHLTLTRLDVSETNFRKLSIIDERSPTTLILHDCKISQLRSLRDSAVEVLDLAGTDVKELDDLAGCRSLRELDISNTRVRDLTPVSRCPVEKLTARKSDLRDLNALKTMPITSLDISGSKVRDLSPLAGSGLRELVLEDIGRLDLKPLMTTALETLVYTSYHAARDDTVLGRIGTLRTVNGKPFRGP